MDRNTLWNFAIMLEADFHERLKADAAIRREFLRGYRRRYPLVRERRGSRRAAAEMEGHRGRWGRRYEAWFNFRQELILSFYVLGGSEYMVGFVRQFLGPLPNPCAEEVTPSLVTKCL